MSCSSDQMLKHAHPRLSVSRYTNASKYIQSLVDLQLHLKRMLKDSHLISENEIMDGNRIGNASQVENWARNDDDSASRSVGEVQEYTSD